LSRRATPRRESLPITVIHFGWFGTVAVEPGEDLAGGEPSLALTESIALP
jgi:hypothetical protein